MHGMRTIRLVDERGDTVTEYSAVTHPAVGERVRYKDNFYTAFGVTHALKSGRDGGGEYTRLDVVIIKVKQEPLY